MPCLLRLVASPSDRQLLCDQAAKALVNVYMVLSMQPQMQQQVAAVKSELASAGAVATAARLLREQGPFSTRRAAAAVVCLLAHESDSLSAACVAAGVLPGLLQLLSSGDTGSQAMAAAALRTLAVHSAEAAAAMEQDELASRLGLLQSKDRQDSTSRCVAGALAMMGQRGSTLKSMPLLRTNHGSGLPGVHCPMRAFS